MYVHILFLIPVLVLGFILGALWMARETNIATNKILDALNKSWK
jgi:hypothetical protein